MEDVMEKLEMQHKHILNLIDRDKDSGGWTKISGQLYPVLSSNMPIELVEFEELSEGGGRARLTEEGQKVFDAMIWL
jgi:hypothetical protein